MTISTERLRDMLAAIGELLARPENAGHGHVFKRPDGAKVRCGGLALCEECRKDFALKHRALPGFEETFALVTELLASRSAGEEEPSVRVKPLEWEGDNYEEDVRTEWYAISLFGQYLVTERDGDWRLNLDYASGDQMFQTYLGAFEDVDAAKAAAQADYQARVLSTLTTDTPAQLRPVEAELATWRPIDGDGYAELQVRGKRITTFASYPAAEEAANRINAAISAVRVTEAQSAGDGDGWQPIETAPKDRTPVIIAVPDKDQVRFSVGEAYFDPENYEGGDWWWAGTGWGDYHGGPISEISHHPPTHWRPLPSAPQKGGQ